MILSGSTSAWDSLRPVYLMAPRALATYEVQGHVALSDECDPVTSQALCPDPRWLLGSLAIPEQISPFVTC